MPVAVMKSADRAIRAPPVSQVQTLAEDFGGEPEDPAPEANRRRSADRKTVAAR